MKPARRPILRIVEVAPPVVVGRYSRAEAVFLREQSMAFKARGWEGRLKPLRTWGELIGLAIGFGIFMAFCVFLATV